MNSILFNVEKNANNNKKKLETIANIVTKASFSSNDNTIMTKDLNNNDQYYAIKAFALKDDNNFSSILSSRSSLNRSTSLKFIEFERNKIAKQSWKSIASTKFARDKKISKRFKQTCVSIINNFDLDILQ